MKYALALLLSFFSTAALAAPIDFSISGMVHFVVYIIIVAAIFWAVWEFVKWCEVKEPWLKLVKIVMGIVALFVVVNILLGMIGEPMFNFH